MQMQAQCDRCQGKGRTSEAKCPHCRGKRVVQENKEVKVQIERGMAAGDTVIMEKEAEQVPDMALGDLIFTIRQKPHPTFKRVGNNLYYDITLTLEESLLGFKRDVKHLDGHIVKIENSKDQIIQPDQWLIIKGEGMPKRGVPSEKGDLHVKCKVVLPKKLSAK